MPTFSWDNGTDTAPFNNTGNVTLNIVDEGVKFTWTMLGGDGSNQVRIENSNGGFLQGNVIGGNNEVFELAPTGRTVGTSPATRFSGTVTITAGFFNTLTGGTSVDVTFFKTSGGTTKENFKAADTISASGVFSKIRFTIVGGFGFNIQAVTASAVNCFCAGTRIATPDGFALVETLRAGDTLRTADGRETTVKWLGEQPIDTRLTHPAKVNPIRITAGALGAGLPERDLYLSADHAIALDGMLINAGALVNGRSIHQVRDMPLDGFTYYHVETEGGHELLLAEGVAAESFIDYAGSDSFLNGDARETTAPIPEMNLPRISAPRLVPDAIRARLNDRVRRQAA